MLDLGLDLGSKRCPGTVTHKTLEKKKPHRAVCSRCMNLHQQGGTPLAWFP